MSVSCIPNSDETKRSQYFPKINFPNNINLYIWSSSDGMMECLFMTTNLTVKSSVVYYQLERFAAVLLTVRTDKQPLSYFVTRGANKLLWRTIFRQVRVTTQIFD